MGQLFTQGHACIVGVGADLPNTVTDAQGIADILCDPERCAYVPEQVQLLMAEQATRNRVLAALDQLATATDPEATVLIYFSGHGYQVASPMGEAYYLIPHGYEQKKLYQTAISGAEFTAKLKAIPAKKLVVLLDCCHAGGLSGFEDLGLEAAKAPLPPETQALLAEGNGRVMIASSKADELSFGGKPYSAFTLAVIEAFTGVGVAQKDSYVRVSDLALHSREVVPRRTRNRQHPILNFEQADNFVLAYYAGGDEQPKGLPFEVEPEIEGEPGEFAQQGGIQIVQNVTQRGKYNVNVGQAHNLRIGDG